MPTANLRNRDYDDFEGKNSGALDVLYVENPEYVELNQAVEIGVISEAARAKIENVLPNHGDLFKAAMERNLEGDGDDAKRNAFKAAFSIVYGKFTLEDSNAVVRVNNSAVVAKINKHLAVPVAAKDLAKNPNDNSDSLKDRPVIAAAMRLLQNRGASGLASLFAAGSRFEGQSEVLSLTDARNAAKTNAEEAERDTKFLARLNGRADVRSSYAAMEREGDAVIPVFDARNPSADLPMMERVNLGGFSGNTLESDLFDSLNSASKLDKLPPRLGKSVAKFSGAFDEDSENLVYELVATMNPSLPAAPFSLDSIFPFLKDFKTALKDIEMNIGSKNLEDLQHFLDNDLERTLNAFTFLAGNLPLPSPLLNKVIEDVKGLEALLKKTIEAQWKKRNRSWKKFGVSGRAERRDAWNENYDKLDHRFSELAFAADDNAGLPLPGGGLQLGGSALLSPEQLAKMPGLANVVADFKTKYLAFKAVAPDARVATLNVLRPMAADYELAMAAVEAEVNNYLGGARRAFGQAEASLSASKSKVEAFGGIVDNHKSGLTVAEILERAFSVNANPGDMMGKRREMMETQTAAKDAQAAYEYCANGKNFGNVSDAAGSFQTAFASCPPPADGYVKAFRKANLNLETKREAKKSLKRPTMTEVANLLKGQGKGAAPDPKVVADQLKEQMNKYNDDLDAYDKEIDTAQEIVDNLQGVFSSAKGLQDLLKPFLENIEAANAISIDLKGIFGNDFVTDILDPAKMRVALAAYSGSQAASGFNPKALDEFAGKLLTYLTGNVGTTAVPKVTALQQAFDAKIEEKEEARDNAKDAYEKAKKFAEGNRNLSDEVAARRIVRVMVDEQYPELNEKQKQERVEMILAEDIARIRCEQGYEEIAKQGSEEVLATVKNSAIASLLEIRYKVAGSEAEIEPLKGFKAEELESIEAINKLFGAEGVPGKLNLKNGFFVLAALLKAEADGGVKSIQVQYLRKRLKALLAEELGATKKMSIDKVQDKVDEEFENRLKGPAHIIGEYLALKGGKQTELDRNAVKAFEGRYKKLKAQRILGPKDENGIDAEQFELDFAELLKDLEDSGLKDKVSFPTDSMFASYANSPQSQWVKDLGKNVGKFTGRKALSLLESGAVVTAKGIAFGGAKLVGAAVKYPFMIAAKPLVGFVNLFRKKSNKWRPLPSVLQEAKSGIASTVSEARAGVAETFSKNWKGVTYDPKSFKDTMEGMDGLDKKIAAFAKAGRAPAVEIGADLDYDFSKAKAEIAKLIQENEKKPGEVVAAAS